jgi:hypothetical protein
MHFNADCMVSCQLLQTITVTGEMTPAFAHAAMPHDRVLNWGLRFVPHDAAQ